jgi:hypothetical protein
MKIRNTALVLCVGVKRQAGKRGSSVHAGPTASYPFQKHNYTYSAVPFSFFYTME